jgi:hypothetical protein
MAATELRKVISDYLDYSIDFGEFASKFARASYGIREFGDSNSVFLCNAIESRIAEAHLKLISDPVLREALSSYAGATTVTISRLVIVSNDPPTLNSSPLAGEVEDFNYTVCA